MDRFQGKYIKQILMKDLSDSQMEIAVCMAGHIMHPCGDLEGHNLRGFYIRESKRMIDLKKIRAPEAVSMLLDIIEIYEREVYTRV